MNKDEKVLNVIEEIYTEMYREAEPSADYEILKDMAPLDPPIYKRHYLDEEKQQEILDRHLDESNVSGLERDKVRMTVNLGAAPITSEENRVDDEYEINEGENDE